MIENYNLLKYLYQSGSYSLEYMIQLVEKQYISQEVFFEITRHSYQGCIKNRKDKIHD